MVTLFAGDKRAIWLWGPDSAQRLEGSRGVLRAPGVGHSCWIHSQRGAIVTQVDNQVQLPLNGDSPPHDAADVVPQAGVVTLIQEADYSLCGSVDSKMFFIRLS